LQMECRDVGQCRAFRRVQENSFPGRGFGEGYMALHPYMQRDVRIISGCAVTLGKPVSLFEGPVYERVLQDGYRRFVITNWENKL